MDHADWNSAVQGPEACGHTSRGHYRGLFFFFAKPEWIAFSKSTFWNVAQNRNNQCLVSKGGMCERANFWVTLMCITSSQLHHKPYLKAIFRPTTESHKTFTNCITYQWSMFCWQKHHLVTKHGFISVNIPTHPTSGHFLVHCSTMFKTHLSWLKSSREIWKASTAFMDGYTYDSKLVFISFKQLSFISNM